MTTKKENTKELTREVMANKTPDYMGEAQEIILSLDESSTHQLEKHKELEKLLLDVWTAIDNNIRELKTQLDIEPVDTGLKATLNTLLDELSDYSTTIAAEAGFIAFEDEHGHQKVGLTIPDYGNYEELLKLSEATRHLISLLDCFNGTYDRTPTFFSR